MSEKTFEQILAEAIGTEIRAAYKAIQSENKIHDGVADIYSLIPGSVPNEYGYLNYIGKNTGPLTFDYSGLAFSLYPSQTFRLPFRGGNLRVTGGTLNPQQVFLANTPTFNSQQDIASSATGDSITPSDTAFEQLPNHPAKGFVLQASNANTGTITITGSNLTGGIVLSAGQSYESKLGNTNLLYAMASTSGQTLDMIVEG